MSIYFYYTFQSARTTRLKKKLSRLGLEVHSVFMVPGRFMPKEHFLDILRQVDDANDILAMRSKRMTDELRERLASMSLSELYEYLRDDPRLLREAIIYRSGENPKVVIGYNQHEFSVLEDRKTRRERMSYSLE